MFLENSSLRVIEADAQDVVAVYRSKENIQVSYGSREPQVCEAFIVVVQEEALAQVYVALSFLKSKSLTIFTPEDETSSQDILLKEAMAFLQSFGFILQPVGLNYSKALKEVILSDLRVVRPVVSGKKSSPRKPLAAKTGKPVLTGSQVSSSGAGQPEAPVTSSDDLSKTGQKQADTGTGAVSKKDKTPQPTSSLNQGVGSPSAVAEQRAAAERERDRLREEKNMLEQDSIRELENVRKEQEVLKLELERIEQNKSASLQVLRGEVVRLAADIQTAQDAADQEVAAAQQEVERLSRELEKEGQAAADQQAVLGSEVDALRKEREALVEKNGLALQVLRQELSSLSEELSALHSAAEDEQAAVRRELDSVMGDKTNLERERVQALAALKEELASLRNTEVSTDEISVLNEELRELRQKKEEQHNCFSEERARLLETVETLRGELQSMQDAAADEFAGIQKEHDSLRELHAESENRLGLARGELVAERDRLLAEHNSATTAAEQELEGLRAERDQLSEEIGATLERLGRERETLLRELATLAEEAATMSTEHERELSVLAVERERLSSERAAALSSFVEQQKQLQASVAGLLEECTSSEQNRVAELAALREEYERLSVAEATAKESAAAERSVLEQEVAKLNQDLMEARTLHDQSVEGLQKEIARLVSEREHHQELVSREIGALQVQVESLNREIFSIQKEVEEEQRVAQERVAVLEGELAAQRSALQAHRAAVAERFSALECERDGLTEEANRELSSIHGTAQMLVAELIQAEAVIARRAASARQTALSLIGTLLDEAIPPETLAADEAVQTQIELLRSQAVELASANESAKASALTELATLRETVARLAAEKSINERKHAAALHELELEAELILQQESLPQSDADSRQRIGTGDGTSRGNDVSVIPAMSSSVQEDLAIPDTLESCTGTLPAAATDYSVEKELSAKQESHVEISLEEANVLSDVESDDSDPFAFLRTPGEEQPARPAVSTVPGPAVKFSIDGSLPCIRYSVPDEVVELYQSLNRTRVAMEDNTTVTCDAFLAVIQSGGLFSVHIGLYLVDSKRVLVYAPERQPSSKSDCANIVQNGLDFIEIVGFMMDGIGLGKTAAERKKILGRVPVLCQTVDQEMCRQSEVNTLPG